MTLAPLLSHLMEGARAEGFVLSGGVDFTSAEPRYLEQVRIFDQWLARGYADQMAYLGRGRERRANPKLIFPDLQSVFCVAIPYPRNAFGGPASRGPRFARYLNGQDYHEELPKKLEAILQKVQLQFPALTWKINVDTSAVLERAWAALSGLGWIGKNTLLMNREQGSYLFLAVVFLNLPLSRAPQLQTNLCGHCKKCLEACPTGALRAPHELDARLCISNWTLERKKSLDLSEAQKKQIGTWVAGCDLCQEACPFNIKPSKGCEPVLSMEWESLQSETPDKYSKRIQGTAFNRMSFEAFQRNLALAIQNRN